jgi:sarcosine oxidase subunit beta
MTATPGKRLPGSASVVVIGGGALGVSTAFHLAEAGVPDVLLLERDALGSGSTCKAAGGVRAQFSDDLNIALGARSLQAYADFARRPGQEIDLHRVGYLWLLSDPADVAAFEAGVERQNAHGVPSRMIDVQEAQRRSPLLRTDGLLAAAFSPADGHCTPESVVLGYATGARGLGARLLTGCTVTGIETRGSDICAVLTDRGRVATDTVVCAAGAWSRSIGAMVGVDLPVTPLRRQIVFTAPMPDLPAALPMTIDFGSTLYFHREGRGLLIGMSDPDEQEGFHLERSDGWLPRLTEAMGRRAPGLLDVGLSSGWAGLYEMTPDHNALIGEATSLGRFLYATGFSGHGFLMAPAVGEVLRDLYMGATPFVDVAPLDARRFGAGAPVPELHLI